MSFLSSKPMLFMSPLAADLEVKTSRVRASHPKIVKAIEPGRRMLSPEVPPVARLSKRSIASMIGLRRTLTCHLECHSCPSSSHNSMSRNVYKNAQLPPYQALFTHQLSSPQLPVNLQTTNLFPQTLPSQTINHHV